MALAPVSQAQAGPGLQRVGPVDPVTGYPLWYQDTTGLQLGLCTDPAFCGFLAPDPALATSFPGNWPEEAFYYMLSGAMTGVNGARAVMTCALEAAFVNGPVVPGDQIVFTRVRLRITNLVDGASYRITHPYGVETIVAGTPPALPGEINLTRDIGIGVPGDFAAALAGDIGPFVTPLGFAGGPNGSFISDGGLTLVPVQGSPILVGGLPANYLRIEGPDVGLAFPNDVSPDASLGPDPTSTLDAVQLDLFAVTGQIASRFGVGTERAHYMRTTTQTAVNVWASSTTGQLLSAQLDGGPVVPLQEDGASGRYFVRAELGAGAPRPQSLTLINLSDNPPTVVTEAVPDLVSGTHATFTMGGSLAVEAGSSDLVAAPTLTATVNGATVDVQATLIPGGGGLSVGNLTIPAGSIPPTEVRISSANGGEIVFPVKVVGTGVPAGAATVLASAGVDQTVASGALVNLDGTASLGPVAGYAWTHDAGALITLVGDTTATPSFTAPTVSAPLDITLTLTVSSADATASSQDTVVVHVQPPLPADVLTIDVARYLQNKQAWRIRGTSSVLQGHLISVYLGPVNDTSRKIGDALVDITGAWLIVQPDGLAQSTGTVPGTLDVSIWAVSELGGQPVSSGFQRR